MPTIDTAKDMVKLKENVSNGVTTKELAKLLQTVDRVEAVMLFCKNRNGIPVKVGKTFRSSYYGTRKKKGGQL